MNLMRYPVILIVLFLPMLGCRHKQMVAKCPTIMEPDSVSFRSAHAVSNPSFQRGQQTKIMVTLQYTLTSQDSALLEINLDQFPSVSTCSKDVVGMIRLLPTSRVRIERGSHVIQVPLNWPGDTGEGAGGTISGKGTLSIEGSLIAEQLNYNLLTTRFGLQYCQQF